MMPSLLQCFAVWFVIISSFFSSAQAMQHPRHSCKGNKKQTQTNCAHMQRILRILCRYILWKSFTTLYAKCQITNGFCDRMQMANKMHKIVVHPNHCMHKWMHIVGSSSLHHIQYDRVDWHRHFNGIARASPEVCIYRLARWMLIEKSENACGDFTCKYHIIFEYVALKLII